jgi:hypothetical protein
MALSKATKELGKTIRVYGYKRVKMQEVKGQIHIYLEYSSGVPASIREHITEIAQNEFGITPTSVNIQTHSSYKY